jgi:hypothetical protein
LLKQPSLFSFLCARILDWNWNTTYNAVAWALVWIEKRHLNFSKNGLILNIPVNKFKWVSTALLKSTHFQQVFVSKLITIKFYFFSILNSIQVSVKLMKIIVFFRLYSSHIPGWGGSRRGGDCVVWWFKR